MIPQDSWQQLLVNSASDWNVTPDIIVAAALREDRTGKALHHLIRTIDTVKINQTTSPIAQTPSRLREIQRLARQILSVSYHYSKAEMAIGKNALLVTKRDHNGGEGQSQLKRCRRSDVAREQQPSDEPAKRRQITLEDGVKLPSQPVYYFGVPQ